MFSETAYYWNKYQFFFLWLKLMVFSVFAIHLDKYQFLTIPSFIKKIGVSAFSECSSLMQIAFASFVTDI